MAQPITIVDVQAETLAAVTGHVAMADIPAKIMPMMDKVWAFIRERGIEGFGHNVWLYRNVEGGEMDVEIGVQMPVPFTPEDDIVAVQTPAGQAAHAVHSGDYSQMGSTHSALMAWCAEQGKQLAGIGWEVYGDWHEDPAKLRTDVYQLISRR